MQQVSAVLERTADREATEEPLLRMNDAGPSWDHGVLPLLSISVGPKHTHTEVQTHLYTHTLFHFYVPADVCFLLTLQFCQAGIASSRLTVLYSFHVLWKSTLPSSLRWMTVHPPPALSMLQYTYTTDIKMSNGMGPHLNGANRSL